MLGLVYPGVDPSDVVRDAGVRGGEAQAAPGVRAERDYADLWNNNSEQSLNKPSKMNPWSICKRKSADLLNKYVKGLLVFIISILKRCAWQKVIVFKPFH